MKKALTISKKKVPHWIKQIILVVFDVFIMFSTIFVVFATYTYFKTPPAAGLVTRDIALTTVIYDRTGQHILYEIHGEENRKIISHDEIPNNIRLATIAAEDDGFYHHYGIDFLSILRAIKNDLEKQKIEQGASTITQQLARNAFLSREKTFRRKFLETILALKIEKKFSKDQILDMYLNEVPYGSNAYGIQSAAEIFFNKNAKDLTLDEAAFLAALTKATAYYSPYGNHSDELVARQKKILDRIAQLELANIAEIRESKKINTLDKVAPFSQPIEAPHFVFYVKEELEKLYGQEAVEEGGLRVYTTLDYEKQKLAEKIVSESAVYNAKRYGGTNAALIALDPKNGQILAMVGSKDYFDKSIDGEVNVTIRPRQPGSSFKPFAYAKAFEKGYQPETLILDAQTNFGPDGSGKNYIPRNYDGKFHGIVSMRQALAMSLNVPAIKTLQIAGLDDTIELAHRLGITTLNDRQRYGLSLVIGGGEVQLLDETSGFSVFANDGKRNPADPFLKIIDGLGRTIYANQPRNISVLDPQVARKINSILSDNNSRVPIFGPNNKLHIDGKTVAAKTGTTQEFRDAWTVGYTPSIAVGVWAGNNDNRPMRAGADGSYVAAPIWNKFMSAVIQNYPDENFIAYDKMEIGPKFAGTDKFKLTYYDKKKGKEISSEKAKKKDPKKIEVRVESVSNFNNAATVSSIDATNLIDPLTLDWKKFSKTLQQ